MKNVNYKLLLILFAVGLMFSCTAIYEEGKDLASVAKREVNQIPADTLKSMIDNGEGFLLLDVRQPAEYEAGNITGSFSIPRGELEFLITDEAFWEEQFMYVPLKTDKIIIYCKVGDRGILAAQALQKLGFTNIFNLAGGYTAFAGENATVVKKAETGGCGS
jgi:rhodanese-related sulfurtransferase